MARALSIPTGTAFGSKATVTAPGEMVLSLLLLCLASKLMLFFITALINWKSESFGYMSQTDEFGKAYED